MAARCRRSGENDIKGRFQVLDYIKAISELAKTTQKPRITYIALYYPLFYSVFSLLFSGTRCAATVVCKRERRGPGEKTERNSLLKTTLPAARIQQRHQISLPPPACRRRPTDRGGRRPEKAEKYGRAREGNWMGYTPPPPARRLRVGRCGGAPEEAKEEVIYELCINTRCERKRARRVRRPGAAVAVWRARWGRWRANGGAGRGGS